MKLNLPGNKYFIKYNDPDIPRITSYVIPKVQHIDKKLYLQLSKPLYIQTPILQCQQNGDFVVNDKLQQFLNTLKVIEDQLLHNIIENRTSIFNSNIEPEIVKSFFNYNRTFEPIPDDSYNNSKYVVIYELKSLQLQGEDIVPIYQMYKYKKMKVSLLSLLNILPDEPESDIEIQQADQDLEDNLINTYASLEDLVKTDSLT